MGYRTLETINYFSDRTPETGLNIQEQREILVSKVIPIIEEGIENEVVKPNDKISPYSKDFNGWILSKDKATYDIIESVDDKTNQKIVYVLVRYGKEIKEIDGDIDIKKSQMEISVSGDNFVLRKDQDSDRLFVPTDSKDIKNIIFQYFSDQSTF